MRRTGQSGRDGEVAGALRRGAVSAAGKSVRPGGRPLLRVVTGGRSGLATTSGWRRRRGGTWAEGLGLVPGIGAAPAAGAPGAALSDAQPSKGGQPDQSGRPGQLHQPGQPVQLDRPAQPHQQEPADPYAPDAGMSTVEYAVGTVVAAAFAAVLYRIVTGDSIVSGLQALIDSALHTVS
jgi:hypothetical protein